MHGELGNLLETCLARLDDIVIVCEVIPGAPRRPRIIYVNDAFVRRTGYSREFAIGKTPHILHGPATEPDMVERVEAALEAGGGFCTEIVSHTKTGDPVWLELAVTPVTNHCGDTTHWVSIERDITARKRAQQQLRETEHNYRLLFDANPVPMWVFDSETLRFCAVNDAAVSSYGYAREQFFAMTIDHIESPDSLGRCTWGAGRHRTADGRTINVDIASHAVMFDGRRARLVLAQDVTNQLAAAEALRASEANLATAQRIAHLGSWELDCVTGALRWSDETYRMFGIEPRAFAATYDAFLAAVHPDDRAAMNAANRRAREGREPLDFEHRIVRPDGSVRWVYEVGELEIDRAGQPLRLTGAVLDITSRKRDALFKAHKTKILRAISSNSSLPRVLAEVVDAVESIEPTMLVSILTASADGDLELRTEAGLLAGTNVPIGPHSTPYGIAAYRKEPVLIANVDLDPLAADVPDAASIRDARACWSLPVLSLSRAVLGVIVVWNRESCLPGADELELLSRMVDVVRIAIEHDRKDQELRASEERFRMMARATNDVIWDWSVAQNALWWSDGITALFGFERDELESSLDAWSRRIHPDEYQPIVTSFDAAIASDARSWTAEYRFRRKDGSYAHVSDRAHIVRGPDGKAIRVVGGITDITERTEAQAQLREQAMLLDSASDAILVRDLSHRIVYWNRGAEALYGWSAAETHERRVDELLYPDVQAFQAATQETLKRGAWTGELQQRAKDGRLVTVLGRWTLLRDPDGRPQRVLAINTDITERKQLGQHLLRAQRLESIGTLAGGIAHDLNNVLQPVLMAVDVLRMNDPSATDDDELTTIEACASRGAGMIRQLLSFVRGGDGQRAAIALDGVARELRQIVRETFPKNVTLDLRIAPALPSVHANATQIQQLLLNLCVNARDAMPTGGSLSIAIDEVVLDAHSAGAFPEASPGPYVSIAVTDTGTGMPADVLERIFDPFFTTKEVGKGTGLGLFTVHAIVRDHRGFLRVTSEPGKGSTFRIYLPAQHEGVAPREEPSPRYVAPDGKSQLVLVVDDEDQIRTVARRLLERNGYRVLTARNGSEAVVEFERHRDQIAVVLLDMSMPGMDGVSTIKALTAVSPDVRIVGVSGLPTSSFVSAVTRFVAKPFTGSSMLEAIVETLAAPPRHDADHGSVRPPSPSPRARPRSTAAL